LLLGKPKPLASARYLPTGHQRTCGYGNKPRVLQAARAPQRGRPGWVMGGRGLPMAVFFFLVASIGGVVVADLVLENATAGEVTVFTLPVSGYSQGELLAMAAALGFVVAVLLVASLSSTQRRRARRRQLRAIRASLQRHAAAPGREQAAVWEEWFARRVLVGEPGGPAPPTDPGREQSGDGGDDRPVRGTPGPTVHLPGSFHQRTRRAAHLRDHPDLGFPPNHQHPPNGRTPPRSGGDDGRAPAADDHQVPADGRR
jgi:hypothetical protein